MMKHVGYTLIEVMVALAVFAILAGITGSAMYHAFDTRKRVNVQANQLNALQVALTLIQRDTQQAVERAIHGDEMRVFPPFVGQSSYVEFTRSGAANPNAEALLSTLKRVAYVCKDNQLLRRTWESLDTPTRKNYQDKVLLENLDQCAFAYLAANHQLLPEWREYAVKQNQKNETLPSAIQFNVTVHAWGNMSMLFILPEALYAS